MAEVIEPEAFNERFTIGLDAAGQLIERTVRQMTTNEVLTAVQFYDNEIVRLEREAQPWSRLIAEAGAAGRLRELDLTGTAAEALHRLADALNTSVRLETLIMALMPGWQKNPVRRFRP